MKARPGLWSVWCGVVLLAVLWAGCGDEPGPVEEPETPMEDPRCPPEGTRRPLWLPELQCARAFLLVASNPDAVLFPNATSVKFVIDLEEDNATYFIDGRRYALHYDFCKEQLNKPGHAPITDRNTFNQTEYRRYERRFILGTITYYAEADVIALEFATGDTIQADQILFAYNHLKPLLYFGDDIIYRPLSVDHEALARGELAGKLPIVFSDELYRGITYQPLNPGKAWGYLRLRGDRGVEGVKPTEIVVLNEAPNDIRPVAGVITEAFQTPLSHVNILSRNRGTPNMGLRGALDNPDLRALADQLVVLEVTAQQWSIKPTTLAEAEAAWERLRPAQTFVPPLDLSVGGLPDLTALDHTAVPIIGAKAANIAEMTHAVPPLPLPDRPFAVPFSHYWAHIERNGLRPRIEAMLGDPRFTSDPRWRTLQLQALRDSIEGAPIDPDLVALLYARVRSRWGTASVRFRSSTNSEDLTNFNGAGLYESFSGSAGGDERPLEDAVRKVWASLWTQEATDEREFYRIDHRAVAMAVLVHPAFPDEASNGVALTANIYNPRLWGYIVNVQVGEASVTNPGPGEVPDQFFYFPWYDPPDVQYLSYSNLTEDGTPVLTWEETLELGATLMQLHNHFRDIYNPDRRIPNWGMDVEFKFLEPDHRLIIKQARPIPQAR